MAYPQRLSTDAIHLLLPTLAKIQLNPTTLLTSTKTTTVPKPTSTSHSLSTSTLSTSASSFPLKPSVPTTTSSLSSHPTGAIVTPGDTTTTGSSHAIIYIVILFLIIVGSVGLCVIRCCCWCRGGKNKRKAKKESDEERAKMKTQQEEVAHGRPGFATEGFAMQPVYGYGYAPQAAQPMGAYPARNGGRAMPREEGPRWVDGRDIREQRGWEGAVRPGWEGRPL